VGAHNELRLEGLTELRAALKRLPGELVAEAQAIVVAHAEDARRQMDAKYAAHEWTGNLRRGLSLSVEVSQFGVVATLKNRAPHAYWAEHGTQLRRTSQGVSRGAMPPIHVFIPIASQVRRRLEAALTHLVERAGLVVGQRSMPLAA
jgi:hypothetical protein